MKVLRSWLADFVDLDGDLSAPEALRAVFVRAGIGVAEIAAYADGDLIFDLEVTANRPDLLCHVGVAREIALLTGKKFTPPAVALPPGSPGGFKAGSGKVPPAGSRLLIEIASDRCERYTGLVVRDIAARPSPDRMVRRLKAMALNSISNIVDATNYVLFEMNHPLHAFDLDKLEGGIVVRQARDGERLKLLDGRTITLTADDLVIADQGAGSSRRSRPVALAGVMGGADTAVDAGTRNLLLEAAWFLPSSVRRTARRHGIATDSSYRFERGADRLGTVPAMSRLLALITETSGGRSDGGMIDVGSSPLRKPDVIRFRASSVKRILGHEVPAPETILRSLGAIVDGEAASPAGFAVTAPSWRVDLTREIDLIEEIARVSGYESLGQGAGPAGGGEQPSRSTLPPLAEPTADFNSALADGALAGSFRRLRNEVASFFSGQGLDRCVNFSFESPDFGDVVLTNPMNAEESVLRSSLLPGLRRTAISRADRAGTSSALLFEIDKTFHGAGQSRSASLSEGAAPEETHAAAVLLQGAMEEKRYDGRPADPVSIDHAIGILRELGTALRMEVTFDETAAPSNIHRRIFGASQGAAPSRSAAILFNNTACGRIGELDAASCGFEIDLLALHREVTLVSTPQYVPLPKFPSSTKDLAFWVDARLSVGKILEAVGSAGTQNLESAEIFDIFTKTGEARKSVAVRLVFRSVERTLMENEIVSAVAKIAAHVVDACDASLRDKK